VIGDRESFSVRAFAFNHFFSALNRSFAPEAGAILTEKKDHDTRRTMFLHVHKEGDICEEMGRRVLERSIAANSWIEKFVRGRVFLPRPERLMARSCSRFNGPLLEKIPDPNSPRALFYLRVKIDKFPRRLIGIENFAAGTSSRRQSQKVVLPVETPP